MQSDRQEPSIPAIRSRQWQSFSLLALAFLFLFAPQPVAADPDHEIDTANWIALPIAAVDGFFPTPWACGGTPPTTQSMLQFHQNWHCSNPDRAGPNWGNRFFGFHKQFLLGYDRFLLSMRVKTWVASPGALIPPAHGGRPKNAPCNGCKPLPNSFKLPAAGGTLDRFATVNDIGNSIVSWHNLNHGAVAGAGGTGSCLGRPTTADMGCPEFSPNDPIFYRYHHIFDDVQDAWRTHQPTDIAIVLDRSGSMSLPTIHGGTRLDAAKAAAGLFADLLEDGSSHRLGMVSFSTTASSPPDMPLTSVSLAPAALSAALSSLVPDGLTSIGDGLQKAQTLINPAIRSETRKAILLLTDGEENTPPSIVSVEPLLGDTHVCSIGFGTPASVGGPGLQDLSQRQGGIFMTTTSPLELKKFFVFCFANIFDTFGGKDPIGTLPAGQFVSSPTIHFAFLDEKIVFVLGWTNPAPPGTLQLSITTPSGNVLNLDAPGVQSKFGPTWHIVRIKTPFNGERDGNWVARAIRPIRTYVNGFSSRSFADFQQGVALVETEIANLCANGCRSVLYYEDPFVPKNFGDFNSIYAEALFRQSGQRALGAITRPTNATEFYNALRNGYGETGFDLVVYSSQFTQTDQPYDSLLAQILCSNGTRAIISDNRRTSGAQAILRCAGALRGERANFTTLVPSGSLLDRPATLQSPDNVVDFSYELIPTNRTVPQVFSSTNVTAVVAQGETGRDEDFFITVLARSTSKIKPFTHQSNTYTLESLHPTFHIPEMYWPSCGFDTVTATVNVTRPMCSFSKLLASVEPPNGTRLRGDTITQRDVVSQLLQNGTLVIPTETKQFTLYDDGTNGDETRNDHYWEVDLPQDFTSVDGDYQFHAVFRLCKRDTCGRENCVDREAQQSITVRTQMQAGSTNVTVQRLQSSGARCRSRIVITPADRRGNLLGPGLVDELVLTPVGNVTVESKSDLDGRGAYQILVNWGEVGNQTAGLKIAQFGRPMNAIQVTL